MFRIILVITLAAAMAAPSSDHRKHMQPVDMRYGGPTGILRFPDSNYIRAPYMRAPNIDAQNRIISKAYSPAFLQPIWILDYRLIPLQNKKHKSQAAGPYIVLPNIMKDDYDHKNDLLKQKEKESKRFDNEKDNYDHHHDEPPQFKELNRLRNLLPEGKEENEHRSPHDSSKMDHHHRDNDVVDVHHEHEESDHNHENQDYDDEKQNNEHNHDHDEEKHDHEYPSRRTAYNIAYARLPDVAFTGYNKAAAMH